MDAGTIVASAAVLVSAAALVYTWRQDRATRVQALADLVRVDAATMLAKLGRWQELITWFYSEVGPILVDTAEKLAAGTAPAQVRDWTWKQFPLARTDLLRRISAENLETVAPHLGAYDVVTLERFAGLLRELKDQERASFEHFMTRTQQAIAGYTDASAVLTGNDLRELAEVERRGLDAQLTARSAGFCAYLTTLIGSSSPAIMARRVRLEPAAREPAAPAARPTPAGEPGRAG